MTGTTFAENMVPPNSQPPQAPDPSAAEALLAVSHGGFVLPAHARTPSAAPPSQVSNQPSAAPSPAVQSPAAQNTAVPNSAVASPTPQPGQPAGAAGTYTSLNGVASPAGVSSNGVSSPSAQSVQSGQSLQSPAQPTQGVAQPDAQPGTQAANGQSPAAQRQAPGTPGQTAQSPVYMQPLPPLPKSLQNPPPPMMVLTPQNGSQPMSQLGSQNGSQAPSQTGTPLTAPAGLPQQPDAQQQAQAQQQQQQTQMAQQLQQPQQTPQQPPQPPQPPQTFQPTLQPPMQQPQHQQVPPQQYMPQPMQQMAPPQLVRQAPGQPQAAPGQMQGQIPGQIPGQPGQIPGQPGQMGPNLNGLGPVPGGPTAPGGAAAGVPGEGGIKNEGTDELKDGDVPLFRRRPVPAYTIQIQPGVTMCQNCLTTTTPLWRRDENGAIMCNACGLFLKLHGRRRPISLKTDVIKSRNRSNRHQRVDGVAAKKRGPPADKPKSSQGTGTPLGTPGPTIDRVLPQVAQPRTMPQNGGVAESRGGIPGAGLISGVSGPRQSAPQTVAYGTAHTLDGAPKYVTPGQPQPGMPQAAAAAPGVPGQPGQVAAATPGQPTPGQPQPGQTAQAVPGQPAQPQTQPGQPQAQQPGQPGQPAPGQPQYLHPSQFPGRALGYAPSPYGPVPVQMVYPASPALSPYVNGTPHPMLIGGQLGQPLTPAMAGQLGVQGQIPGQQLSVPGVGGGPTPLPPGILAGTMMHPMSPQAVAQTQPFPLGQLRGAMSEQLLPRSPESAERIPCLTQVPVAQFQRSQLAQQERDNILGVTSQPMSQPAAPAPSQAPAPAVHGTPLLRPQGSPTHTPSHSTHTPSHLTPTHATPAQSQAASQAASQAPSQSASQTASQAPSQHQSPGTAAAQLTPKADEADRTGRDSPRGDDSLALLTRVSELELVNDLLKRRVQDLEAAEAQARQESETLKRKLADMATSPPSSGSTPAAETDAKRAKVMERV